jgi:hypothetical protein
MVCLLGTPAAVPAMDAPTRGSLVLAYPPGVQIPVPPSAHRPRIHRLHAVPPVFALVPVVAPRVASDTPARLYFPSPATGRRMGAPQLVTPGALPDGFRFHYADGYHGWPVQPLHFPHALHGMFNDPREGGYHFGIDIAVDDSNPAQLAPAGMSHRIFAVESGMVHYPWRSERTRNCNDRRFQVGHFSYWHASPTLPDGTYVHAGQVIGWTCLGEWHVHLSEWALVNGQRVWVNPLHRAGKLQPYADNAKPIVRAVYAYGPPAPRWSPHISSDIAAGDGAQSLTLDDLHGPVDLRAWIDDSQGDVGLYRRHHHLATNISPNRIWVQIRRVDSRAIVFQRNVWQSDILLTGRQLFYAHFAAGSRPPLSDALCTEASDCTGRLFYHLLVSGDRYLWDTRLVGNGAYILTIRGYDISGNEGDRTVPLTVRN